MSKLSINLSRPVYDRVGAIVTSGEGPNVSIVCEAALIAFERVPANERRKMMAQLLAERRPQTPRSVALFWTALADEFGVPEMAGGAEQYLMAARPYGGFQVLFDAQHALRPGCENEIVIFTETAPPYTEKTRRIGYTWPPFSVTDSVFTAAHDVAEWIRTNKAQLAA